MSVSGLYGIVSHVGTQANRTFYRARGRRGGTRVVDEAWDTLLILDGCRYDMFADACSFEGVLQSRRSFGSESSEFIRENFVGQRLHDTVYVTSNPYASIIPDGTFHYLENLLETGWDRELNTVPPDAVADAVEDAHRRFPNKRIIGHFMQPHYPFIGETGRKIDDGGFHPDSVDADVGTKIWTRLQYGLGVTQSDVWAAYRENLELVLDEVESVLASIDGRIVITADHGNLVGDRQRPIPVRGYGHPANLYVDGLVEVPWFVVDGGDSRDIHTEKPIDSERLDESNVTDRLEALGYR